MPFLASLCIASLRNTLKINFLIDVLYVGVGDKRKARHMLKTAFAHKLKVVFKQVEIQTYSPFSIGRYPVHRHKFPCRHIPISSTVGTGLLRNKVYIDITIPGVQKPH